MQHIRNVTVQIPVGVGVKSAPMAVRPNFTDLPRLGTERGALFYFAMTPRHGHGGRRLGIHGFDLIDWSRQKRG